MKLVQYQIQQDLPQDEIRKIARKILRADQSWHFFHEGHYSLIRMEANWNRQATLEKHLNKAKIKFDSRPYDDPHELVRKYQDLFIPMFHAFTILGLERESGEINSLLERAIHCFCNMAGFTGLDEEIAISRVGVLRMKINNQFEAMQICQQTFTSIEKFKREKPDEFEKQFAAVPAPKKCD